MRCLTIGLALSIVSQQGWAFSIEEAYGSCDDVLPITSANHATCEALQYRSQYRELQKEAYRRLTITLSQTFEVSGWQTDARVVSSFEAAQAAWEKYYPEACELSAALTLAADPWQSAYSIQCEAEQLKERFEKLNRALICFEKMPASTRHGADGTECLNAFALSPR